MTIRLGMIGASAGNGHPYSWSAIFNGYNPKEMQKCGYPVIPAYLNNQRWPEAQISGATVSTVWTQDLQLSRQIAQASCIDHVSLSLDELKDQVDGVLLARDDSENHLNIAKSFLIAGKPIYIDKPIAISKTAFHDLYKLQQYDGQIFTCSALRYSPDFILSLEDILALGKIVDISASTPKSWKKYAVHIIEPVLKMISTDDKLLKTKLIHNSNESRTLNIFWKSGMSTNFTNLGEVQNEIQIKINGEHSSKTLIFKDTFTAFKLALQDFVNGIIHNECRSSFEFNIKVVNLIEKGLK